jgi:ketosteroid isomerase-like protein
MSAQEHVSPAAAVGVVRRYLDRMVARDWEGLAACLAPDIVRLGPYGDDYRGVDDYVPFLRLTLESLADYEMRVDRVTAVGADVVVAELSETVTIDGSRLETPEALVFDLAPDGRIGRVAIFLRRSFTPR